MVPRPEHPGSNDELYRNPLLEPDSNERAHLLAAVAEFADRFLESEPTAKAFIDRPDGGAGILDDPVGEEGIGIGASLDLLREHVTTVGINPTSGRFLGYIPGGGLFYSALGDFLAAVTNRYGSFFFASPGAVRMENQLVRWMADLIGYPASAGGYLAVGGSVANQSAIVTARDHCGIEGPEIERSVVYLTVHAHHCIDKALRLAGLRRCVIRRIEVDDQFRMDAGSLQDTIEMDRKAGLRPWLVVASAGTTNTGSVDPIESIGQIAAAEGLWYHVDAAYGGFFLLCSEVRHLLSGMERADSVVMDPHKTLFLPYGTGTLLVKDHARLQAAHFVGADYLQDADLLRDAEGFDDRTSPADVSPELTKHWRGLRLWLPLKVVGLAPFREALSEKLRLARDFHDRVGRIPGFEVGPEPDLSVVTFRFVPQRGDPDAFNRRLVRAIHEDGRVFLSTTQINGRFTLRMAAVCFRTHQDDIDLAIEILEEKVRLLETDDYR